MLFSSYAFVFGFLPLALAGHALALRWRHEAASWFLVGASLAFYALWRPLNVAILLPSVAANFAVARFLLGPGQRRPRASRAAFLGAVAANLCFLGYFKYAGFLVRVANDATGLSMAWAGAALPLGISFVTFQKLALLADVRCGRVTSVGLRDYLLFVLFFPPLVAGPIVHYREVVPQFAAVRKLGRGEDACVGAMLFSAGLAKKLALADPLAGIVAPLWLSVAAGGHPALLQAWMAALGYMLQLYFDFSGYSDMAIGVARMLGIRLPPNFDSPLKAASVIEFWSRWHMTLTRFLTAYVFTPLSFALATRRAARGGQLVCGRSTGAGTFAALLAFPTMSTMLLSGLWHGAGYQFIAFGAVHGAALVANHAWRTWRPRGWRKPGAGIPGACAALAGWSMTFAFVVCAETLFRAPSVGCALRVLGGMAGRNGVTVPYALASSLASHGIAVGGSDWGGSAFLSGWALVAACLGLALGMPNAYEMLDGHEPALGFKVRPAARTRLLRALAWRPGVAWAVGLSGVSAVGLLSLGRLGDFLYWRF